MTGPLGFSLENVGKRKRPPGMDQPLAILREVTLEIPAGKTTVLLGPPGGGKTMLLRLLCRLEDPTSGRVAAGGRELSAWDPAELRRRVGFVRANPVILPGKVEANLHYALRLLGLDESERVKRVNRHLLEAGLTTPHLGREDGSLTLAEKLRVAIARALVLEPGALLLDDPAAGLDTLSARDVFALLATLRAETGITFVVATRSVEHARSVAHRVILFEEGKVTEEGDAGAFFSSPKTAAGRAYVASRPAGVGA